MRYPQLSSLLALSLIAATSNSLAAELIPNTVTVGKTTELALQLDIDDELVRVDIIPSGPQARYTLPRSGKANAPFQLKRQGESLLIVDEQLQALAEFSLTVSATVKTKIHKFVAEGIEGLAIYDLENQLISRFRTTGAALDVAVADGMAYIATGSNGLTLLDIYQPKTPVWLSSHQKLGRVTQVATDGHQVIALNDDGVVFLVDSGNVKEPTVITAYRSARPILDVAVYSNWVFTLSDDRIEVIDISIETPQISNEGLDFGQGVNFGGERRVYIENNLAYVADWFSGMHIYDISRAQMPVLLSSYHTPGSPKGIVVRDGIAYVPDDDHGLQIIDVSNPRAPTQLGHIQTRGLGYTPKLVGDLLYLASHHGGFQIIDIHNPAEPTLVSEFDTDGKAWSLAVQNNVLYVADDEPGLLMFDISDPTNPKQIGQFSPGAAAEEVLIRDNIAFVAFFDDGLYILDISDPSQAKLISHTPLAGNTRGLDLQGDTLYVASWLAGVHLLDISELTAPKILSQYDTRGATWGIQVDGEHLYAMDWWGGIAVIDISNPNRPLRAGGYHDRGKVNAIAAKANYIFVAQGSNGLQVFDIKNPLNPTWVTGVEFPGTASDIALINNTAYMAAQDGGVAIIDISNPFNVRWLSSFSSEKNIQAIISDHSRYLYLLTENGDVYIADASEGRSIRLIEQLKIGANDIWLDRGLLYAATAKGITLFNIEGPQTKIIAKLKLGQAVSQIHAQGDIVLAAAGDELIRYQLEKGEFKEQSRLHLNSPVKDISSNEGRFYVNTATEIVAMMTPSSSLEIKTRYPLLGQADKISPYRDTLYISGDKTVIALNPVPDISFEHTLSDEYLLKLPASLAVGSYDLVLTFEEEETQTISRAFAVEMIKFSKPKLSMEAFKKIMEQKKNTDLFVSPPK